MQERSVCYPDTLLYQQSGCTDPAGEDAGLPAAMTLKENIYKAINTLRLLWMVGLTIFQRKFFI